jgi:hypothetical protein
VPDVGVKSVVVSKVRLQPPAIDALEYVSSPTT